MRVIEISSIYINGKKIEITHEGLKPFSADSWHVLLDGITQDFEIGKGYYQYANFEAGVSWKCID